MFGVRYFIALILMLLFTVGASHPVTAATPKETGAELMPDAGVVAMCFAKPSAQAGAAKVAGSEAQHLTYAAVDIYGHIYAAQTAQDASDIKAMDQLILNAEDRVCLPPPAKFNQALKWKKLVAWTLDRLVWGGALFLSGVALAWLARLKRFTRDVARLLMSVSMTLFGCAYAMLLPVLATLVVVGFVACALKTALARMIHCCASTALARVRLRNRLLAMQQLDFAPPPLRSARLQPGTEISSCDTDLFAKSNLPEHCSAGARRS